MAVSHRKTLTEGLYMYGSPSVRKVPNSQIGLSFFETEYKVVLFQKKIIKGAWLKYEKNKK